MNNFIYIIIGLLSTYVISYFLTRLAMAKSESHSDNGILTMSFFVPFFNIIVPLLFLSIVFVEGFDIYKFFRIK
jgi:hypothetical protein